MGSSGIGDTKIVLKSISKILIDIGVWAIKFTYKNYVGEAEFDQDTQTYEGVVTGIRDVIHSSAKNKEEIEQALHDFVEDYIDLCKASGKIPEKS